MKRALLFGVALSALALAHAAVRGPAAPARGVTVTVRSAPAEAGARDAPWLLQAPHSASARIQLSVLRMGAV